MRFKLFLFLLGFAPMTADAVSTKAVLTPAPEIHLSDKEMDGNNPSFWVNGRLRVFFSEWVWNPRGSFGYFSEGDSVETLTRASATAISPNPRRLKWIEAVYPAPNGTLYGWYHSEELEPCTASLKKIPRVGALRSFDNGETWEDLGIVLEAQRFAFDCEADNGFFAGGLGDFSVIPDRSGEYLYFLFSHYPMLGGATQQGVGIARMHVGDLDSPQGKVWKWFGADYSEPGLGGNITPIFPATRSFLFRDPDSFWGPAIHYNTHLGEYVIALARTKNNPLSGDTIWLTEGIYLSYGADLADPRGFSEPELLYQGGGWYPQIFGVDASQQETETLLGQRGRFFIGGHSRHEIQFYRR